MKVKNAESVASFDKVSKVLGREQTHERTAQIAENPTVHTAPLLMVFRYLAPVKTWSPYDSQTMPTIDSKYDGAYLDECIVEQEHDSGGIPNPGPPVIEHLAYIANVADLWMTQAEFPDTSSATLTPSRASKDPPDDQRCVKNRHGHNDRDNEAWDQTQNGVRVRE